ncbi:MAG: hypothetical protein JXQ71_07960 [Verrucomicrobia bacterium]|nr:hypothetical protein [Verrucomicrobiota bacterium]
MNLENLAAAVAVLFGTWVPAEGAAPLLAEFDFTRPAVARQWRPERHIASLQCAPEGLAATLDGFDPYFSGPARDYPADTPLWVRLRVKSDAGGGAQLFFYADHPREERSVRFHVAPGAWREVRLRLPPLGRAHRFRLDPPGTNGVFVLASLTVAAATPMGAPESLAPEAPRLGPDDPAVTSGALTLVHGRRAAGEFELRVGGVPMAIGHNRPQIGYVSGDRLHWVALAPSNATRVAVHQAGRAMLVEAQYADPHQALWDVTQRFWPSAVPDAIEVEVAVRVNAGKTVVLLPLLTVLPGAGTFGTNKHQGLFAGLEYLDNEPSRSEADVRGPAAHRLVPDTLKITFPLMAIQAGDRYVGVCWEMQPHLSALFDSPDRTFKSGAHALALLYPGSDGEHREDGHLLPHEGMALAAGHPVTLRATLVGGPARSVVPAIETYVRLRGLPPLPDTMPLNDYVRLAAGGWLDSAAREGLRYRHAVWPGFGAQPAADAACYMDWLAQHTPDAALAQRLGEAAQNVRAQVPRASFYSSAVSHVRFPVAPLVYGHVEDNVRHAAQVARNLLGRFEPDGRVLYRKTPGGVDYGSTHFAPDANGLTAQVVMSLLDAAAFCGDRALIEESVKRLRALDAFRHTVPRGAQTWECPLHTPDVLASAHLVRAYTLGYELTGDPSLLAQAREWAWTGVPFVYLRDPTGRGIGRYLTPPVYGATGWVAPVWMGLPVQWCGLVYADALYRFARHDPGGIWKTLADGITVGGVQITWPAADRRRQGLLPDVFHLRAQHRDGPAINPGTVQACAARWYTGQPLHDFRAVRERGWLIHAPGDITPPEVAGETVRFTVRAWPKRPAFVLVHGCRSAPRVALNRRAASLIPPHRFADGRLILQVEGRTDIEIIGR